MNRLHQLKKTIEKNIQSNEDYPNVEFVVLNYNSQDGLDEWVKANLMKYIEAGILNYYHTTEPDHFHASKAKNLAHKLADGDVLCNLDGDNFTGEHFARYINYLYNKHGLNSLFHFYKKPLWGTTGRIAYSRKNFIELGGYDESFLPMGYQDWDIIQRFKAKGHYVETIQLDNFLHYLSNSTDDKIVTYRKKSRSIGENEEWFGMNQANEERSKKNIMEGNLAANSHAGWGQGTVYKNFESADK